MELKPFLEELGLARQDRAEPARGAQVAAKLFHGQGHSKPEPELDTEQDSDESTAGHSLLRTPSLCPSGLGQAGSRLCHETRPWSRAEG